MNHNSIKLHGLNLSVYSLNTVIVGTGAAGLNAADCLYAFGQHDIAIVTEGMNMGTSRNTCPLNDGHDYVFEMNYFDALQYAEETFGAICTHNTDVRVCIEYKLNDPRTRCLFGTAGETLAFCQSTGIENLGVVMDIGHSLIGGERPAQTLAQLHRAGKLFYVHLNDNDRKWDWDMLPGAYNLWEFVEFLYYLKEADNTDDWYAFDVLSKEVDPVETFTS